MFIATFVIYTVDECGRNAIRNKLVQNTKLNVTFAILIFSLYLIEHSDIASPFRHLWKSQDIPLEHSSDKNG